MKIILQDSLEDWQNLLPFTYTKPISAIRVGIDTIKEKWEAFLNISIEISTEEYLMPKFQNKQADDNVTVLVNSSIIPNKDIVDAINNLTSQQTLEKDGVFIAQRIENSDFPSELVETDVDFVKINYPWDLFKNNSTIFEADFQRITTGRESQPLSDTNRLIGSTEHLFIEEGASIECAILNTKKGSIYIGKNATIMEGCIVQGGLALCESSTLKMGAKHYGTSTIGPHSKIGGEVGNIVVQGYSNKGHDGYLGNAVLGEWCNLGADTNSSNLKNNYGYIRAWNYKEEQQIETGEQFIGLMMGDHAKCGINTMFNTATVVGTCANVFGGDYPPKHIPAFAWGGVNFIRTFTLSKAYEMAEAMMKRRGIAFTEQDKAIFDHIFAETAKYRD